MIIKYNKNNRESLIGEITTKIRRKGSKKEIPIGITITISITKLSYAITLVLLRLLSESYL